MKVMCQRCGIETDGARYCGACGTQRAPWQSSETLPSSIEPNTQGHPPSSLKVLTTDDNLVVYQECKLNSTVIARPLKGTAVHLGDAVEIEGRGWIRATLPSGETGHVLGASARSHTISPSLVALLNANQIAGRKEGPGAAGTKPTWCQRSFGILLLLGVPFLLPVGLDSRVSAFGGILIALQLPAALALIFLRRDWVRVIAVLPVLLFSIVARLPFPSIPLAEIRGAMAYVYLPSLAILLVSPQLTFRLLTFIGIGVTDVALSFVARLGPRMWDSYHRGYEITIDVFAIVLVVAVWTLIGRLISDRRNANP